MPFFEEPRMSWQGVEGHDAVVEQFRRALKRGRLASTFLFVGPPGIGKRTLALKLAQALLCQQHDPAELTFCGHCANCVQLLAGTHPDLLEVRKPTDKSSLPVELFIGPRERRMQEGLCHDIRLKPFMGGRRVAIIDDADYLNEESANCLLKTLEEPPPRSVMILLGTSADRQMPTIRSRSQIIRFEPLPAEVVAGLLVSRQVGTDRAEAVRLARHCDGSLARAEELADPELWKFRSELLARLAEPALETVRWAKTLVAFVEAAGKDAAPRRARARQVIGFTVEFYRQLARRLSGAPLSADEELQQATAAAAGAWTGDAEAAVACAQRCLDALAHVERNANQATLLECWLDDLAQIAARGLPLAGLG
jgi:DNA polymerase-3 subunit delta'